MVRQTKKSSTTQGKLSGEQLYAAGLRSHEQGDFKTAISTFKESASLGCLAALNSLGVYYDHGIGVRKNRKRALDYYLQAARGGDTSSIYNIGILYLAENNPRQALKWLEKLNPKKTPDVALAVAKVYLTGWKNARNHQAIEYLKIAVKGKAGITISKEEHEEAQALLNQLLQ